MAVRIRYMVACLSVLLVVTSLTVFSQGQNEAKTKSAGMICPVVLMMNNGGYCTYYAMHCPSTPTTLLRPCGADIGCNDENDDCIQAHHAKNGRSDGRPKRLIDGELGRRGNAGNNNRRHRWEDQPEVNTAKGQLINTRAIRYPLKNVEGEYVYAQLFFVYVQESAEDGNEYPEGFVASGHEIDRPPPRIEVDPISPENVERIDEHCHLVKVEGVPYIITTYRGTEPDPES